MLIKPTVQPIVKSSGGGIDSAIQSLQGILDQRRKSADAKYSAEIQKYNLSKKRTEEANENLMWDNASTTFSSFANDIKMLRDSGVDSRTAIPMLQSKTAEAIKASEYGVGLIMGQLEKGAISPDQFKMLLPNAVDYVPQEKIENEIIQATKMAKTYDEFSKIVSDMGHSPITYKGVWGERQEAMRADKSAPGGKVKETEETKANATKARSLNSVFGANGLPQIEITDNNVNQASMLYDDVEKAKNARTSAEKSLSKEIKKYIVGYSTTGVSLRNRETNERIWIAFDSRGNKTAYNESGKEIALPLAAASGNYDQFRRYVDARTAEHDALKSAHTELSNQSKVSGAGSNTLKLYGGK